MFSTNIYVGVFVAVSFIITLNWFVIKNTKALVAEERILFLLNILVTNLLAVWCVDKIVAHQLQLLTPDESKSIFEIFKTLIVAILAYYLGSKKKDSEK